MQTVTKLEPKFVMTLASVLEMNRGCHAESAIRDSPFSRQLPEFFHPC